VLVLTVMLLALLVLICIGLLTLTTAKMRASGYEEGKAEARANARLSLMLALGELQEQLGPDQRITASAGLLDADITTPTHLGDDTATDPTVGARRLH